MVLKLGLKVRMSEGTDMPEARTVAFRSHANAGFSMTKVRAAFR
jgi:hypothetical protein